MIDFRYHVVSLVAVLLALATGILVGSSLLNQPLIESLNATTTSLAREKEDLRAQLTASQDQVGYRDRYGEALARPIVGQRLAGQRVLLVTLPGVSGRDVEALAQTLRQAGATLSGQLTVEPAYFDQAKAAELDGVVRRLALPGVEVAADDSAAGRAAPHLARALLADGGSGAMDPSGEALLSGFDEAGFVQRGRGLQRGGLAVLVAGEPKETGEAQSRVNSGVVALARAFDAAGAGAVLTGPVGAAESGAVAALRGDRGGSGEVSTVDPVSSPFGRIAAVFALAEQAAGKAGHYGSTGRTDGPAPKIDGGNQ